MRPAPAPRGDTSMDSADARPTPPVAARRPAVQYWVGDTEQTRWVTMVSLAGILASIALVLVGGFPLDMPMPTHSFGWVEPTCGLTRGSTALIRGDLALAWHYNPASFLVVGGALVWLVRSAIGGITHRWLNVRIRPTPMMWLGLAAGFAVLWAVQQSNADFIITSRL